MKALSIFILGFLGGVLRFALGDTFESILLVNAVGTLALGMVAVLCRTIPMKSWIEVGLKAGLIGSFTSFSSIMIDTVRLYPVHVFETIGCIVLSIGTIMFYTVGTGFARYGLRRVGLEDTPDHDEQSTRTKGGIFPYSTRAFRNKH